MFAVNLPKAALGVVLSNLPIVKLIVQYFDLSILNPKQVNYFASMTLRLMEERKNTNIVYNDFIGAYSLTFPCFLVLETRLILSFQFCRTSSQVRIGYRDHREEHDGRWVHCAQT